MAGEPSLTRRLREMGFHSGCIIRILGRAPFNGPFVVQLHDSVLALRSAEAECLLHQIVPIVPTIALVGSPNSGKTTLFNWLTGSKFKTVNYAGSTVDTHRGKSLGVYGDSLEVLDTPGIYSLQPHGRDEEVTLETLTTHPDLGAVVIVIDGTQLNRQLYLVRQIQELGIPMVVAVTMMDLVKQAGRRLDLRKLSELVDAPVVAVDGRLGGGVADVLNAVRGMPFQVGGRAKRTARRIQWDDQRIEKEIAVAEAWTREVVEKAPQSGVLGTPSSSRSSLLASVLGCARFCFDNGDAFLFYFLVGRTVDGRN